MFECILLNISRLDNIIPLHRSVGPAEIVAGRGSSTEAFPLFGFDLDDYDSLFSEKLDLLLQTRDNTHVRWSGKHQGVMRDNPARGRTFSDVGVE